MHFESRVLSCICWILEIKMHHVHSNLNVRQTGTLICNLAEKEVSFLPRDWRP